MTEREAIVAWLRARAAWFRANAKRQSKRVGPLALGFEAAADAIEAGQHLEKQDG